MDIDRLAEWPSNNVYSLEFTDYEGFVTEGPYLFWDLDVAVDSVKKICKARFPKEKFTFDKIKEPGTIWILDPEGHPFGEIRNLGKVNDGPINPPEKKS